MKKIEISNDTISEIIFDYINNKLSTNKLHVKYNIPKKRILSILKENNVEMRNSGRQFIGGVNEANKRYTNKPGIKEKKSKIHKEWREKNSEHLREYHNQWRKENGDKWRETKRNYEKTRKNNDPIYKLIGNFRTAIYTVLKENDLSKFGHYFEILGYKPEDLINRLENQFKDGICWENYGKWHVDHIKPISSFNFTSIDDEEFKKCWSLDNLQPMWGKENILKSNKY